jgi:hypothetical protein
VISINGQNPAHIHVGDTYSDLGATITGPEADIILDTSQAATNTIDYVVTESAGLTSTRTVIIETVSE